MTSEFEDQITISSESEEQIVINSIHSSTNGQGFQILENHGANFLHKEEETSCCYIQFHLQSNLLLHHLPLEPRTLGESKAKQNSMSLPPTNASSSLSLPANSYSSKFHNPNRRSSEVTDPIRRSYSENPFTKNSTCPSPRRFGPSAPPNTSKGKSCSTSTFRLFWYV